MSFAKKRYLDCAGYIFLRRHFHKGKMQAPYTAMFFFAVSIRVAILFMARHFFEIYAHYGVFNRGTNLVSV